ncbi:MAG: hypothetical protein MH252_14170 [Thermosynechococcaceae cyanobacterium MS004]|nr:hypothetical protein [Thermosynechococcaceae cyanobacterium MS004]
MRRSLSLNLSTRKAQAQRRRTGAISRAAAHHGRDTGGGRIRYLDYIKNYIKPDIQQGWGLAYMTGIWAIARMRLGGGGAAKYLELLGL